MKQALLQAELFIESVILLAAGSEFRLSKMIVQ